MPDLATADEEFVRLFGGKKARYAGHVYTCDGSRLYVVSDKPVKDGYRVMVEGGRVVGKRGKAFLVTGKEQETKPTCGQF